MTAPDRHALAEALAALTESTEPPRWRKRQILRLGDKSVRWLRAPDIVGEEPWTMTDPAEAEEVLSERGLLPEGWCDPDHAVRWWCERCDGTGKMRAPGILYPCGICEGVGACDVPAGGIPDIVSLASLGVPAIQRAEMLPREACRALREYGCPQPEWVVWRVGERDADRWIYRQRDYGADSRGRLYEAHRSGYSQMLEDRATEGVEAIWLSGLAVDRITADAVQIVVPPVGGSRG